MPIPSMEYQFLEAITERGERWPVNTHDIPHGDNDTVDEAWECFVQGHNPTDSRGWKVVYTAVNVGITGDGETYEIHHHFEVVGTDISAEWIEEIHKLAI